MKNSLTTRIMILVLFLIAAGCRQAGTGQLRTTDNMTRFETELESIRKTAMIPGMSAAVVKDQQILWAQGFGYANLENGTPSSADTPYFLASVTKPFAAILIMQLVEQGRMDLEDPISKYGIQLGDPESIQVRHLLSHTSNGIPGAEYQYNGDRFAELDLVFQPASGSSFWENLSREITGPTGMQRTVPGPISRGDGLVGSYRIWLNNLPLYREQAKAYRLDQDYQLSEGQCSEFFMPAAGLISTVKDLAAFDIALDQDQFLLPETKARMFSPTVSNTGEELPYGLGWFSQSFEGKQVIWHYGWQPGCSSTLYIKFPEDNITFFVLANADNLSRPYRLGSGEVFPFDSTVALAFYKAFIFEPAHKLAVPLIDWENSVDDIVAKLEAVENTGVLSILERELLSYNRLFQSVGQFEKADRLMQVHAQVFQQTTLDGYAALIEPVSSPVAFIRLPLMTHLNVAILIFLVTLSWAIGWPALAVAARIRKNPPEKSAIVPRFSRITRALAVISGFMFITILVLYILYLSRFPADGLLVWTNSGIVVKVLLGAALLSGAISIGALLTAILGLIRGEGTPARRIHYIVIGVAYALNVYLWTQLGFYDWMT